MVILTDKKDTLEGTDERFNKLKDYNVKRKDRIKEALSGSFHENKDHINEEKDKNAPSKKAN